MRGKINYKVSRSAVLLDGECSEAFDVEQGVAQGCSLSPILLSVFINGLLKEVEQASLAGADPGGGLRVLKHPPKLPKDCQLTL